MNISVSMSKKAQTFFLEIAPALQCIYEFGFIPREDEICEFTKEMYKTYRKKTGDTTKPLYTIIRHSDPDYLDNQDIIKTLDSDGIKTLKHGITFFKNYAKKYNLPDDSDTILKHAANFMPPDITEGTDYETTQDGDKDPANQKRDAYAELYKFVYGENEPLSMKIVENDSGQRIDIFAEIEDIAESEKMTYDEYKKYAVNSLQKIFENGKYTVETNISQRADDVSYDVIHICEEKDGVTIYNGFRVRPYYNDYFKGMPLSETILEMVKSIENSEERIADIDINKMDDFDKIMNVLIIKPVNYRANKKMLEECVYRREADIAIVLYAMFSKPGENVAMARIPRLRAEGWNISNEYLLDLATENTARLFKPILMPLEAAYIGKEMDNYPAVNKYFMEPGFIPESYPLGSCFLSVEGNTYCSTVIFCKGVLEKLSELMNDDLLIIIPTIYVADVHPKNSTPINSLKKIIKSERKRLSAQRKAEDLLSDRVYLYTRKDGSLIPLP